MRVVDLCSGRGTWGIPFLEHGHSVTTLDIEPKFTPTFVRDILTLSDLKELEIDGRYDVVVASPPCECFSVASLGHHWTGGARAYIPATPEAVLNMRIAWQVFYLVAKYDPALYVIENPRGILRKIAPLSPTATIWYCRFGASRAKPTDIWTNMQVEWPSYQCHNGNPDHEAAPRGAKTGTQGIVGAERRAEIPYDLANFVRIYAESCVRTVQ